MDDVGSLLPTIKPYSGENGTCDDGEAIKYLNLAMSLLWNKSDFEPTTSWYEICCVDGCLTLPSEIKQIRLAWKCGNPISIGDQWYQSIPQIGMLDPKKSCWNKFVQSGSHHVTFQEYTLGPYNVRLMPENKADTGVEITVHIVDEYGTKRQETITLGTAPETTDGKLMAKGVIGITKPKTMGRVRLYAYDPSKNYTLLLAVYQPYDINPQFRRFKLAGRNGPMTVFAKRKFVPVESLADFVYFTQEAIIHAIQAVVYRENKDNANYLGSLSMAVAEINRETADQEIPVGAPLRMFCPDRVVALNPITWSVDDGYGGYGYGGGYW